jgi:phage-related protein
MTGGQAMGSSPMADRRSARLLTRVIGRRWRDYETESGARPVKEFIAGLSDADAAEVAAAMAEVKRDGLRAARHLRGEIYEVRADGRFEIFRILFASEGRKGRILLALEGFSKKDQKTPPAVIKLAEKRLADWRERGRR